LLFSTQITKIHSYRLIFVHWVDQLHSVYTFLLRLSYENVKGKYIYENLLARNMIYKTQNLRHALLFIFSCNYSNNHIGCFHHESKRGDRG